MGVALLVGGARGEEGEPVEDPLSPYRLPFDVLMDRAIGSTAQPVAFNWRRTTAHVGVYGDFLFELNNFNSQRVGGLARFPSGSVLYELGVGYVRVEDTWSSELLALTPYRQPGRPSRMELDFHVGFPLAEGVVTARPRFFPALQMVFMGWAGVHYSVYPMSFDGMKAREVAGALLSPGLTETEIDNLDERRLDAMEVDPLRFALMAGFGDDIYLRQNVFVSPRVTFNVPLFTAAIESDLWFWGDLSVVGGVTF